MALPASFFGNGESNHVRARSSLGVISRKASWQQDLRELETALVSPEVRSSVEQLENMLHPEFVGLGSTGRVYNRQMIVRMMSQEAPGEVIIRDFETQTISEDTALVTYRSIGQSGEEARRSSIWVKSDGQWRIRFHQGTRIPNRWGRVS
jgi:ribonuclease HI